MVLSEAEGFLKMARADLATALESSDPARFREAAWGFWLQQAAEKGLKAWLHQHRRNQVSRITINRLVVQSRG